MGRHCYLLPLLVLTSLSSIRGYGIKDSQCTREMFGNDAAAYWSCLAQFAHQCNWYPSPIAGLFSYQSWNGYDGFWQNGVVLETMANFMHYGNNTRYKSVIDSSLRQVDQLILAYYPQPSYDDMAWYGLSYARIYEITGKPQFLAVAKDIFNWNWQHGWDKSGTCAGGMWFDQAVNSKQTITNVQMFKLGAKLHRLLQPQNASSSFLQRANLALNWTLVNQIVNPKTFLVADGINISACGSNHVYGPTYNSGVLIGGLIELYLETGNKGHLEFSHKLAVATITNHTINGTFAEFCDYLDNGCNDDAKMFKGIFVRNLRQLMDFSNITMKAFYRSFMIENVKAVLLLNSCNEPDSCHIIYKDGPARYNKTTPVFGTRWGGPFNEAAPMQQTTVLDLFVSAIMPGTRCHGDGCAYDPPIPPPHHLTCEDNPCPTSEQCCEYQGSFATCCTPDQTCNYGYCE